jgi:hypothetical protein
MAPLKLFKVGETESGVFLLRSQLALITNVNSHTLKDGVLSFWNGKYFEETKQPYEIVESINLMKTQRL